MQKQHLPQKRLTPFIGRYHEAGVNRRQLTAFDCLAKPASSTIKSQRLPLRNALVQTPMLQRSQPKHSLNHQPKMLLFRHQDSPHATAPPFPPRRFYASVSLPRHIMLRLLGTILPQHKQ